MTDPSTHLHLAGCLSHTETRSGEAIAQALGCSRTAVWKHVQSLRALGVSVDAVAGQGYRLSEPLELLNSKTIQAALPKPSALKHLHVLGSTESTNDWLLARPLADNAGVAVLAEHQSHGRGRHGRPWVSPFGRNIYLSLVWRFECGVGELGGLPLMLALSACRALDAQAPETRKAGTDGLTIKWPNDLLLAGRKLGGCLVEVQGDASGPCFAVLGIGINLNMPAAVQESGAIDQPWTDLASHIPGISRNAVAAALLAAWLEDLAVFEAQGLAPFVGPWGERDALQGRRMVLKLASGRVEGIGRGISERGGLLLDDGSAVREYMAGEASIIDRESSQ